MAARRHTYLYGVYRRPTIHHDNDHTFIHNKHHAYFDWAEKAKEVELAALNAEFDDDDPLPPIFTRFSGQRTSGYEDDAYEIYDDHVEDQYDNLPSSIWRSNVHMKGSEEQQNVYNELEYLNESYVTHTEANKVTETENMTSSPIDPSVDLNEDVESAEIKSVMEELKSDLAPATTVDLRTTNYRIDIIEQDLNTAKENISQILDFRQHDKIQVEKMDREMKTFEERLESLKREVNQLRKETVTEREAIQAELLNAIKRSDRSNQEIEELKVKLNSLKDENDSLKSHVDTIKELQKRVTDVKEENETLKDDIESKWSSVQHHQTSISNMQEKLDMCVYKGDDFKETLITTLDDYPDVLKGIKDDVESAVQSKVDSKLQEVRTKYEDLDQAVTDLQDKFLNMTAQTAGEVENSGNMCTCKDEISNLKEQISDLNKEVIVIQNKLKRGQSLINSSERVLSNGMSEN